ncbi:MAG: fused MFS/spermidine synthase [Planctomycetota bacterium]|jgi:spermidine synthase
MTTELTENRPTGVGAESGRRSFWLVGLCFLLSGFAGLLYETVWFRQFATVFGTSDAAIGAVLASYMGGLAIGSALAGRWANRVKRPVLAYGLLEVGVALGALLIPVGLQAVEAVRLAVLGGQPELPSAGGLLEIVADSALAFVLIGIPTICMGATLPLLARHVARDSATEASGRVGLLYAINTFGAVLGTLVAAFVLLPALGLWQTTLVGVVVNGVVFGLAVVVERVAGDAADLGSEAAGEAPLPDPLPRGARELDSVPSSLRGEGGGWADEGGVLLWATLVATVGVSSFIYEVLWTRLLSQILGGSVFAFATMLSAFLVGIAAGGWLAGVIVSRGRDPRAAFCWSQLAAACGAIAVYLGLDLLLDVCAWVGGGAAVGAGNPGSVAACLLILLPSTVAIGMTFPLAVRAATHETQNVPGVTGRLYAASTIGCVLGALLGSHFCLPLLGFGGTISAAAAMNLSVATGVLWFAFPAQRRVAGAACAAVVAVIVIPFGNPTALLMRSSFDTELLPGELLFVKAGVSSTVVLTREHDRFRLYTNGLPESEISPLGAVSGAEAGLRWLTTLPVIARPDAESVLVVGFGGGGAVAGVPSTVKQIDVIELEPGVVDAVRQVADLRFDDPLSDSRVNIVLNDARGALSLTDKSYDAIVSQPSHPWTAGASHLYTREFLQLASSRLTANGVFLQWMNSRFVDETLLKSICATLLDVFPHVRLYQPASGTLMFVASTSSLDVERQIQLTGRPLRDGHGEYQWLGLNDVHDVIAALTLDSTAMREFSRGAQVNTDDFNLLAMSSHQQVGESYGTETDSLFTDYDVLAVRRDGQTAIERLELSPVRVVRRLLRSGMRERAEQLAEVIDDESQQAASLGLIAAYAGDGADAQSHFVRALQLDPSDRQSQFRLLEHVLYEAATGRGNRGVVQLASQTRGLEATVLQAATHYYSHNWAALRGLDGALAVASPGDSALPLALTFRALWRAKVVGGKEARALGVDAIRLIDRAQAIAPTVFAGTVRLEAAETAGDLNAWLESAAYLVELFELQPHAVTRPLATSLADRVQRGIRQARFQNDWQKHRAEYVGQLFRKVQEQAAE